MADAKHYGRLLKPGGQRHLQAAFGASEGLRQLFLLPQSKDVFYLPEDFLGVLNTNLWTEGHTGSGTAFAAGNIVNGTAEGATGTTTQAGISLRGPLGFAGAANAGIEVRFKASQVTALCLEVGFLNAISTPTGAAFSSIDTPAVNGGVGDCAVIGLRTSDTANKYNLCTNGSGGGGQVASALPMGSLAPTAGVYQLLRLQLIANGTNTGAVVATVDDANG